MTWQQFVLEHGRDVRSAWLAKILNVDVAEVDRLRQWARPRVGKRCGYGELFARWHGRPPRDEEWPLPLRRKNGAYEWLSPELTLLASLVGRVGREEIERVLTERLRTLTSDPAAARTRNQVLIATSRLGLQSHDVVGGVTTREAADRVGSLAVIQQAINGGHLRTFRVGRLHVIPRDVFAKWLAAREEPPAGWVRLASLAVPLGISSDSKLPEYASLGHIPDVRLVKGIGTSRGVWYIAPERARQILDDARAGRPLPWHGKPLPGNQLAMWRKWQTRKHQNCRRCGEIWKGPAPRTFDAFCAVYSLLSLGEKRHLTLDQSRQQKRPWRPWGTTRGHHRSGVTVAAAAQELHQPTKWIRGLIRRGLFDGTTGLVRDALGGEAVRITPVGMAMLRGIAEGQAAARVDLSEWMGVHAAARHVNTSITTVHRWRANGEVHTIRGARGLLFERASLEARARRYWEWASRHFRRAAPPPWIQHPTRESTAA